jgi:prepilin-type N-terminal cleavage/methylation domain-containing protein
LSAHDGADPRRRETGFSLPELLAVTTVLAILMAFLVPLAGEQLQMARVRTSVNQFALDLRAARWTAVSNRAPVELVVAVDPGNTYQYTDARGALRRIELPPGVRIVSSTSPIRFRADGSVTGGSSTVIETIVGKDTVSRWTVSTSALGISETTHQRVSP